MALRAAAAVPWRAGRPSNLGKRGERLAARWLSRRGYRILHRRLVVGRDEADLVALDPDGRTLVVVEVKTRSSGRIAPEEGLDASKCRRLRRLAEALVSRREHRGRDLRIDAIAIVWPPAGDPEIRHYVDALE